MGKGKKGKGKKGKARRDIDWAADAFFDKGRAMVYIEHSTECPIFQMKAEEFVGFLQAQIPERMFQLVRNQNGKLQPRPGAFEIGFAQNARTSVHDLWSGLDKGPPRRDKFPPKFERLLPEVRQVLKKFYADLTDKRPEDEEDLDAYASPAPHMSLADEGAGAEASA